MFWSETMEALSTWLPYGCVSLCNCQNQPSGLKKAHNQFSGRWTMSIWSSLSNVAGRMVPVTNPPHPGSSSGEAIHILAPSICAHHSYAEWKVSANKRSPYKPAQQPAFKCGHTAPTHTWIPKWLWQAGMGGVKLGRAMRRPLVSTLGRARRHRHSYCTRCSSLLSARTRPHTAEEVWIRGNSLTFLHHFCD